MPNWCMNYLTLYGEEKNLKRFLKQSAKKESFMLAFAPLDEPFEKDDNSLIAGHPLINQIDAWGTKWCDTDIDFDSVYKEIPKDQNCESIGFAFDTAWSPPLKAVQRISEKFSDTVFVLSWDEPGMCFYGAAAFLMGKTLIMFDEQYPNTDSHLETDADYEEYRELIMSYFNDMESQVDVIANNVHKSLHRAFTFSKSMPRDSYACTSCACCSPIQQIFNTDPKKPLCKSCEMDTFEV